MYIFVYFTAQYKILGIIKNGKKIYPQNYELESPTFKLKEALHPTFSKISLASELFENLIFLQWIIFCLI